MIHQGNGHINLSCETLGASRKLPDDALSVSLRELREAAEPFDKERFDLQFSTFFRHAKSIIVDMVKLSIWGAEYQNLRDDISQEFFLKLADPVIVLQYDPSREGRPWMRRMARNLVIDHIRRIHSASRKSLTFTALDPSGEIECKGGLEALVRDERAHEPARIVINSESSTFLRKLVDRALAALPPRDRAIWLLLEDEISYEEIAQRLGMNIGTVKSALNRIRTKLRDAIGTTSIATEATDNSTEEGLHLFNQLKGPARPERFRTLAS